MATALYRRYRPDTFADVIGQEHVTDPLRHALRSGRVNHAYLFSGPRGCGKTTSARILARCLNCAEGPTDTPCGVCDSCVELARGGPGSLDVVEIDAASHGGVDDARELRERATFAPARDRFKVFIIDEAHMVSPQGFNALLKIVEEPPPHIKFVFATTEPDKVLGTIRSRTHHYPFHLVPPERLTAYLAQLCEAEGVTVGKGVLPLVVRAGEGSVRDSLSVLDQLAAGAGAEGIDYERAIALLGYTHASLLDDVVGALAVGDGATVFRAVDRVVQSGQDPRRFVDDLLQRLRDLIIVQAVGPRAHEVFPGVAEDQLDRMQRQSEGYGAGQLSRAADLANTASTEMSGATSPRLHLELLAARLLLPGADDGERGLGARLDRLERRLSVPGGGVPAAGEATGPAPRGTTGVPQSAVPGSPAPATIPVGGAHPAPAQAAAPAPPPAAAPDSASPAVPADGAASERSAVGSTPEAGAVEAVTRGRDGAEDGASPESGSSPGAGAASLSGALDRAIVPDSSALAVPSREEAPSEEAAHPGPVPTPGWDAPTAPPEPAQEPVAEDSVSDRPAPDLATPEPPADGSGPWGPAPGGVVAPAEPLGSAAPTPVHPETVVPDAAGSAETTEAVRRMWPDVLDHLARSVRRTWTRVSHDVQVLDVDETRMVLQFRHAGTLAAFASGSHAEAVRDSLVAVLGLDRAVVAVLEGSPLPPPSAASGPRRSAPSGGDQPAAGSAAPSPSAAPATGERPAVAPPTPVQPAPAQPAAPLTATGPSSEGRDSGGPAPVAPEGPAQPRAARPAPVATAGPAASSWGSDVPPPGDDDVPGDWDDPPPPEDSGYGAPRRTPSSPSGAGAPAAGASSSAAESAAPAASSQRPAASSAPPPWDVPASGGAAAPPASSAPPTSSRPAPVSPPASAPSGLRPPEDDAPSRDDEDVIDGDLAGVALVQRLLGGTVISEEDRQG